MKNEKLKNKKTVGRPPYVIKDIKQLQELIFKVKNKELTNEDAWNKVRLSVKQNGIR